MNPDFAFVSHNQRQILVYRPWWEAGIRHGMTTAEMRFRDNALLGDAQSLATAFGFSQLALLNQNHGDGVQDVRAPDAIARLLALHGDLLKRVDGDAWLCPVHSDTAPAPVAFGILTADCVPVLVRGTRGWAAIHAGWRGLANGIIKKAVAGVGTVSECVVFAAARAPLYQVGPEVVAAIGDSSVTTTVSEGEGKVALDTAATAINQLRAVAPSAALHMAEICTLSDARFHSFRRDGDHVGRCVTFVVPPGPELM